MKAKAGDKIQSLNIYGLVSRGFHLGTVTKIELLDGVEYVRYHSDFEVIDNIPRVTNMDMIVPQNGIKN